MNKYSLTLLPMLLAVFTAGAQQHMRLGDILDSVSLHYPGVKMYEAEATAHDAAAEGARNWMAPEVGAGFFMTPYNTAMWKSKSGGGGMGASTGMGNFMVSAQQMFPNKKELDANENYMKSLSAVDNDNKFTLLNNLYAAAKTSYYTWLVAQKKIAVLDENQKVLEVLTKLAALRYQNNLGKLNAYYKAKAAIGNIENSRTHLLNVIAQQRIRLNTFMYRDQNIDFAIDTLYEIHSYRQEDSSYFARNRSDIRQIDDNIRTVNLRQNLERAKLKPQFGIKYDHMVGFGSQPMMYSLMAMVKLPIAGWASRSLKANIKSFSLKAQSLEAGKELAVNEAMGAASGMVADMDSRKHQLDIYQSSVLPALRKNYAALELAYEQNSGDLFEVLDAWEALNMTELQYLDTLQELLNSQVAYEKILQKR